MTNTIVAKTAKGHMLKILNSDSKEEIWYFLEDKVQTFVKTMKTGDVIEFQAADNLPGLVGKKVITYITKVGESPDKGKFDAPTKGTDQIVVPDPRVDQKKAIPSYYGQKSPEESERISRLSIASSASTALTALSGQLDTTTITEIWGKMFDTIYSKVNEPKV